MRPIKPSKTVHPLAFDNLSGGDFERLVFAFLLRRWQWKSIDWHGQLGGDAGRDIKGIRETDYDLIAAIGVSIGPMKRWLEHLEATGQIRRLPTTTQRRWRWVGA